MNYPQPLIWNSVSTPQELHNLLWTLAKEYPIKDSGKGKKLTFIKTEATHKLEVVNVSDVEVKIFYSSLQTAARGIGNALANRAVVEKSDFKSLGIMLDCSRNAVMTVPYLKKWLCRLALLGYNMVMLYTEDTYQLPGEPYWGYMRGAYSLNELQELDDFASQLGIEMVGCIQVLGHLVQPLHWGRYSSDTDTILMIDEPGTYQLIDKMLSFWRQAFRSNRIHIGMDEAHELGRGKYLDQHGYQTGFTLFNRHLKKVVAQCASHGFKPIIWSDMFFRMGNKNMNYYDKDTIIPEVVKKQIPKEVALCYWDYYHTDVDFYEAWIDRHRALGFEPMMASGIWTWACLWYNHAMTSRTAAPCITACRQKKIQEIFFTMWGDNGAYCDLDSAWVGLTWVSGVIWNNTEDDYNVSELYEALCGCSYQEQMLASKMQYDLFDFKSDKQLYAPIVLWDDPLLGIAWREMYFYEQDIWCNYLKQLKDTWARLKNDSNKQKGDIDHACNIFEVLIKKIVFRQQLLTAYNQKEYIKLSELVHKSIPELIIAIRNLDTSFRRQWLRRNKVFGLEIMQIRLAGQITRFEETARRINEFIAGDIDHIPELEIRMENPLGFSRIAYRNYASGCVVQ